MESLMERNLAMTFFFAIFWGATISSMRTFKVFHIWTCKRHGLRVVVRLAVGVLILNVVPLGIWYFIYMEPWFVIVPKQVTGMFICAAVSSLSVFSIVFLLPGIMQIGLGRILYARHGDGSWRNIAKGEGKADDIAEEDAGWVFLVTALAYIVVPILVSLLLARVLIAC